MEFPERFETVVAALSSETGVTPPEPGRGFGRAALRVNRKIFAMCVRGRLVVKLPESRVSDLVAAGAGERFDANKGTPMREWLALRSDSEMDWLTLATEALAHVRILTE